MYDAAFLTGAIQQLPAQTEKKFDKRIALSYHTSRIINETINAVVRQTIFQY